MRRIAWGAVKQSGKVKKRRCVMCGRKGHAAEMTRWGDLFYCPSCVAFSLGDGKPCTAPNGSEGEPCTQ